ncbi:hypothetical protein P3T73_16220 [Kiritimatiellota bacterium B12222]|nr:hypothetical protein P3T73_16220 [Kiritimatiellota bacterium B12222]
MIKYTKMMIGAALVVTQLVQAQNAPERSIEDMEAIITDQQARVQTLTDQFMELNNQTEAKINDLIANLSKLKDSEDSKTRVIRLKKMIMDDLQTSMKDLQNKRAQAMQELKLMPEDYRAGSSQASTLALTDAMMKDRVNSLMTIANSLYEHKDVDKYESYFRSSYNDNVQIDTRVSTEYKRNQKQEQNAEQALKTVKDNLNRVKFNVQNQIGFMEAEQVRLAGTPLANQYTDEIARKKEMLSLIDERMAEVESTPSPDTQSVGSLKSAMTLEQNVYDSLKKLKEANAQLRQKGMVLKQQIDLLNAQEVTLERIKNAAVNQEAAMVDALATEEVEEGEAPVVEEVDVVE